LYADANYGGACTSVSADVAQLAPYSVGSDHVSSVKMNQLCAVLGSGLSSDPDSVSWGAGRIDVVGRDSNDNSLWRRSFANGQWAAPEHLGGVLADGPGVSPWGQGRLDVFARGATGSLYHLPFGGGAWGQWENLSAENAITSEPAAVSWGPNRIDVFARGNPDGLWHMWWDGAGWKGPENLGGGLTSGPAVASWGAGRLDVFVKGSNNALWHISSDGGSWTPWEQVGPANSIASAPAAVSWGPNRIDIFAKGSSDGLWHMWWDGAVWGGPQNHGGVLVGGQSASSQGANLLDVFGRDPQNRLGKNSFGPTGWSGWIAVQ
ncbi:MAG: hypothetical protein NTZ05_09805, partial [Chloroflexi bacterium]|nr:hypothetical protein [Chloroflexota bacterium]